MTGLLFIRHAETDMAGTFCGHSDPALNANGRQQVDRLIEELASDRIDAIYSSDLQRAFQTAAPLANTRTIPRSITAQLREIDFGAWEGMTWAEIERRDAAYAARWLAAFPALPAPRGELFTAFEARVLQQVAELLQAATDKRIAVITHAGVMRVVLCKLLNHTERDAWEMTQQYCCTFALAPQEARR